MKESKITKLFAAAQKEAAPPVPFQFSKSVMSAIGRDSKATVTFSLFEELGRLFPRLAWAAVMVIGLCVAAEFYATEKQSSLTDNVEEAANDWLFAAK